MRSGFAHELDNAAELNGHHVITRSGGKTVVWKLPIGVLLEAFEVGLLTHFDSEWAGLGNRLQLQSGDSSSYL